MVLPWRRGGRVGRCQPGFVFKIFLRKITTKLDKRERERERE
jgi:hypothetical protein